MIISYHGGKDLEFNFKKIKPMAKGRWEYGPGLYVTTSVFHALKYAKGSRTLYRVEYNLPKYLAQDIQVPFSIAEEGILFAKKNVQGDIHKYLKKRGGFLENKLINLNWLVNLMVNYEALSPKNTVLFREFLIKNGFIVDIVENSQVSTGEPVFMSIIYDPKIIVNVKRVRFSEIKEQDWILPNPLLQITSSDEFSM